MKAAERYAVQYLWALHRRVLSRQSLLLAAGCAPRCCKRGHLGVPCSTHFRGAEGVGGRAAMVEDCRGPDHCTEACGGIVDGRLRTLDRAPVANKGRNAWLRIVWPQQLGHLVDLQPQVLRRLPSRGHHLSSLAAIASVNEQAALQHR